MGYSAEVKTELARIRPRKACCRRAQASALLHLDGTIHLRGGEDSAAAGAGDGFALQADSENAAVARATLKLVASEFGLASELTVRRAALHRANDYLLEFPPQPKLTQTLNELGILDDRFSLVYGISRRIVRRDCCAAAYLRGAFMAGGFVSEPKGAYHFEIATGRREMAEDLAVLMKRLGLAARIAERPKSYAVYMKGAADVAEALAHMGAYSSLLSMHETQAIKEVRESVNRLVNCETANLQKATTAAGAQLEDIETIEEEVGLESLPGALREIAYARQEAPDATLAELGDMFDPPLSKSAVYHRMRRLHGLAERRRGIRHGARRRRRAG